MPSGGQTIMPCDVVEVSQFSLSMSPSVDLGGDPRVRPDAR